MLKRIIKKSPIESALIGLMVFVLGYGALPAFALAGEDIGPDMTYVAIQIEAMQNSLRDFGTLPSSEGREANYTINVMATAYNSLPGQTDSTPFTTASGTTTRHGVIAANFLPFGTRVKIPEIYGDQVFIVEDRMNARYWHKVDIWMEGYDDAIEFGIKNITIEVYPTS
jgi:3D (Asp-Asp-Asp) domain-containing protein